MFSKRVQFWSFSSVVSRNREEDCFRRSGVDLDNLIEGILSCFKVDVVACIVSMCHCRQKMPLQIPMLLRRSGIPSTSRSIDILFLFIDVLGYYPLCILLLLLLIQVMVEGNCFHGCCFRCKVWVGWHGTRCGSSMFWVVSQKVTGPRTSSISNGPSGFREIFLW